MFKFPYFINVCFTLCSNQDPDAVSALLVERPVKFLIIYRSVPLTPVRSPTLPPPCNVLLEKIRSFFSWRAPSLDFANPLFHISYNLVVRAVLSGTVAMHDYWSTWNWDVRLHMWLTFLLDSADLETWLHIDRNFLVRLFHNPGVCSRRTNNLVVSFCDLGSHL